MTLEVVSPYGLILSEEVDEVIAVGTEGEVGVLPLHVPFITTLRVGILTYRKSNKDFYVFINSGYAEVFHDKVMVLADSAERAEDIDVERARSAMQRAEERMKKQENIDFTRAEGALQRAIIRLQVAEKRGIK